MKTVNPMENYQKQSTSNIDKIYIIYSYYILSYNLKQMDQEQWWGRGQFCPADQHAAPIRTAASAPVRWERERLARVGRGQTWRHESPGENLVNCHQFEDAEEEDETFQI